MRDASGQMYRRNRYYDPQTGQFTQPDPIGLAGGLNAYGFAEGDPISYSDPYGLKVEFKDEDSKRVWNELNRLALQAMNSRDSEQREAGVHLSRMMADLLVAEGTVTFEMRERPALKNFFSGGAMTWDQGSGARVEMDRDYTQRRYQMSNVLTFTHEAGHAWAILTNNRRRLYSAALDAENALRTVIGGCDMRRNHRRPPPCQ